MRAAAVQLNSTDDKDRNLASADRLTRAAAADGAELVVLPEKFNVLGTAEHYRAGAEPIEGGRTIDWARDIARELEIDLVAGSISELREGREKLSNTSVHVGPDGEIKGVYRKIHMFDVVVGGQEYRESEAEAPGDEIVLSETASGVELGLTVCYDLRFPELFRILAVRGARVIVLPAAFTKFTGQAHWEILIRARAIENQAFMIAADQVGCAPAGQGGLRRLHDRRSVGRGARARARRGDLHRRRPRPVPPGRDPRAAAQPREPHPQRIHLARGGHRLMAASGGRAANAVDKRRLILDAAIHVFARQGFHSCRVSDVADEAGVAYGLVYHYFSSKEEILNTLFTERWQLMLDAIVEIDARDQTAREKLHQVAGFIIDSYRHEPDLMKVIIVEVTRAANTFGRHHLAKIREAYDLIGGIVEQARADGSFKSGHLGRVRGHVLLRRDRAAPVRLDLRPAPAHRRGLRARQAARGRGDLRRPRGRAERRLGPLGLGS